MGQFNLLHDKRVMIIVEKGGGEIISDCKRKILAVNRRLYPPPLRFHIKLHIDHIHIERQNFE